KIAAAAWPERPAATARITRSRKSFEEATRIHAGLQSSTKLESEFAAFGNPLSIQNQTITL
ncbi:MAG: hypothetical protein ACK5X0_00460, partial [Rhodospirillales bacterium]